MKVNWYLCKLSPACVQHSAVPPLPVLPLEYSAFLSRACQVCSGSGLTTILYSSAFGLGILYGSYRHMFLQQRKDKEGKDRRAQIRAHHEQEKQHWREELKKEREEKELLKLEIKRLKGEALPPTVETTVTAVSKKQRSFVGNWLHLLDDFEEFETEEDSVIQAMLPDESP